MHKDWYRYPAILDYAEDGISVEFPDLPGCLTCGDTEDEVFKNAKEAMALHLYGMEKDEDPIPQPTPIQNIHYGKNQVITMVEVFMPPFRKKVTDRAIKKTLTIPKWLNDLAEEHQVNYSQILQDALKKYLGVKDRGSAKDDV